MIMEALLTGKKSPVKDTETGLELGFDPAAYGGRESINDDRWANAKVIKHPQGDFLLID